MTDISIAGRMIGLDHPVYYVADIAANHDGDLHRAVALIHASAEAGADAAKFQNFTATGIVSERGFAELGGQLSHQSTWKKSVVEVYDDASIPAEWTPILKAACDEAGIHYFSAAYDLDAVDMLDPFVPAFKIGSGDITWLESIEHTASRGKPMLIATGASSIGDVDAAVEAARKHTDDIVLMQCNTNYTGSHDNFSYISLNVLRTYAAMYPNLVLGLSDHTSGHATTLGAVALGARVVEKHFTDDKTRVGPDHGFSMDPGDWREMVERSRELEAALGSTRKIVEANERETVVIQRRAVRLGRSLPAGAVLHRDDLVVLRPSPSDGIPANDLSLVVGRALERSMEADELLRWSDISRSI